MPADQARPNGRPRNILFLMADDWSPIAQCYGDTAAHTPNVDRLAQQGTVFDHAFCASPSCAVSRATIFTGQHSHTHGQYGHSHGVNGFSIHDWMPSTPKLLRNAGYATGLIGKKHAKPHDVVPFEYEVPTGTERLGDRSPNGFEREVGQFIDWAGDRPFFCHVGIIDPHRGGDETQFDNSKVHDGEEPVYYDPADVPVPGFLPDVPEVRRDLAEYYRAVARFDQTVGACVRALEQSGRADDTLIVITSDHGMPFPGAKASSFDSGHHCPLIVISPDQQQRGIHSDALVDWTCFMPTLLDWAGVEAPDNLPGKSMLPILDETSPDGWGEAFFSHNFHEVTNYYPYRVLREHRYKYVRNLAYEVPTPLPSDLYRSRSWQAVLAQDIQMLGQRPRDHFLHQPAEALYDMQQDPHETTNLIDDPSLRDTAERMRQRVIDFRYDTQDPWLQLSFQRGEVAHPKQRV